MNTEIKLENNNKEIKLINPEEKKILYIFITHNEIYPSACERITKMMKKANCDDYIFVCGSTQNHYYEQNKTLYINCNDKYEGLPEKIIKMFYFIVNCEKFNKYNYFFKLDQDMELQKLVDPYVLNFDFGGYVWRSKSGNRSWHIGKCTPGSYFADKIYSGLYVPWCDGGRGYIVSRNALEKINFEHRISREEYRFQIYEDLYLAIVFRQLGIYPTEFMSKDYFASPEPLHMY